MPKPLILHAQAEKLWSIRKFAYIAQIHGRSKAWGLKREFKSKFSKEYERAFEVTTPGLYETQDALIPWLHKKRWRPRKWHLITRDDSGELINTSCSRIQVQEISFLLHKGLSIEQAVEELEILKPRKEPTWEDALAQFFPEK